MLARPPYEPPPWTDGAWLASVQDWIRRELGRLDLEPAGPLSPRARPWSIVIEVPTSSGRCWFKTTAPSLASDARITPLLGRKAPDLVLTPLAVDLQRGWMLLPDGGQRLRDVLDVRNGLEHWLRILPAYAELQRTVEGRETDLFAVGALDRRPDRLVRALEELLADRWWLRLGEPDGLSDDQLRGLEALLPRLREQAAALDAAPVAWSIQHDDLHDGNVLVRDGGHWIVDWGDAGVGHPFATLLVTLRQVAETFGWGEWTPVGPVAPELERLRDAYLEPWTTQLPRAQLVDLVRMAAWTGMIGRALTWRAALAHADDEQLAEWGAAVPAWLDELLAAGWS